MIIKRNKQQQPHPSKPDDIDLFAEEELRTKKPAVEWSAEAVEAGDLPERRSRHNPPPDERRRGYRRVEDKNLISKALDEANAIRENAYREGFEQGVADGQTVIAQLEEAITAMLSAREDGLVSSADEIAGIAIAVAEKIIKTEVACDQSMVLNMVHDTISKAGKQNRTIIVKVHPDDVVLVKTSLKEDPIPNLKAELVVVDDPLVDQGSCVVETNSGLVDASFATQLEIVRRLFGEVQ